MNNLPVHLSFSAIKEYCSDRQLFYKKYVLREWDEAKWFNTIVGSGVHQVIEDFYKQGFPNTEKSIAAFVKEQYELFKEGKIILNDEDINDRDKTDPEAFKEELEMTIARIVPAAMEYINKKILFKMQGVEIKFQSQVGKAVGFPHTKMQLKGFVDAITEDGVIIDWKTCKKFSPANKVEYMLQGINNALLYAEVEGKLPKSVVFVEFLSTPSNGDKVLEYEAKIAEWEKQKEAGEKVRKPSPPKLKENEERYREHIITLDKWKFRVYLELIDRITRELQGENILLQGLPIPSVEEKYGKYEGWQDFCTKLLGYNPYTGEVLEEKEVSVEKSLKNPQKDPLQGEIKQTDSDTTKAPFGTYLTEAEDDKLVRKAFTEEEAIDDLFERDAPSKVEQDLPKPVYSVESVRDENGNWARTKVDPEVPAIEDFDDVKALADEEVKRLNKEAKKSAKELHEKHREEVIERTAPKEDTDIDFDFPI